MAHEVGGKTSREVFKNSQTRKFADAACTGEVEKLQKLVKEGADPNGKGFQGVTPLLWALSCETELGIKTLLEIGADPNQKADKGITAVTAAATYDRPEFLRHILAAGGNPNAEADDDAVNATALARAFEQGVWHNNDWTNYYILLDAGADINRVSKRGNAIGHFILIYGRFCKIQELLDRGYNRDLVSLLSISHMRAVIEGNDDAKCRDELVDRLKAQITPQEVRADIDAYEKGFNIKGLDKKKFVDDYTKRLNKIFEN